jgi:hypothetical protein
MERPRVRPHVELEAPLAPADALERLRHELGKAGNRVCGTVLAEHVEITICDRDRHFWSPQLSLTAEEHPDGVLLRGRIGPQPHVWTMFVALYAVIAFTTMFALVFAASQWMVDHTLWPLWSLPAAAIITALVYLTAFIGQRLGAAETHTLMAFVAAALELPEAGPAVEGAPGAAGSA